MHQWWILSAITVLSAGLSLVLIPAAIKFGLVDHPGHRKVHEKVTPLTGGPAIFITLFTALAWYLIEDVFVQALLVGGSLIFLTGLADDRKHLSPVVRVLVQIVACLVMIAHGGVILDHLGRLFSDTLIGLGSLRVFITIFAAIGVINAFNMIDGLDGLSSGIFIVATSFAAMYAVAAGADVLNWLLLAALFAVLGILLVNARFPWNEKARVFLGDSGSTLLGFILVWCLIALGSSHNGSGQRAFMPITAVWIIAVPLWDTSTIIWRRLKAGRNPFSADQHHLHHAFLRAGYTTEETWIRMILLSIACGLIGTGFELSGLPDYYSFWFFVACALVYYIYIDKSWHIQRFLGRDFIYNDFDKEEE